MSAGVARRFDLEREDVYGAYRRVYAIVFGDRGGAFVFLVALAAFALVWRTTVTINDNYTIVNGLVALADGHLYVTEAPYGGRIGSPGMVQVDGRAYPRNIGHIVFALPFLWLVQGIATVADPRIALAAGWSLLLLAFFLVGGSLVDRERKARVTGSIVALLAFAANVAVATPLPRAHLALVALQLSTMVLGALLCVGLYRLLSQLHGQRVGLAAGLATGLASPVLFWATVPKRHVVTATLAIGSLYLFYRSREAEHGEASNGASSAEQSSAGRSSGRCPREDGEAVSKEAEGSTATYYRLLTYVPAGLTVWVHTGEGLVLLLAIGFVDVLTARRTTLRALAGIVAVVAVSLIPFFLTNELISGNPFKPPRVLPDYDTGGQPGLVGDNTGGGGGNGGGDAGGGDTGGDGGGFDIDPLSFVPNSLVDALTVFVYLWRGVEAIRHSPEVLVHAFVRSGYVEYGSSGATGLAINLSFVESLPVVGAVVAVPGVVRRHVRRGRTDPLVATDLLALVYAVLLTLLYIHRFPVHAMLTVRYLFPLFPLAIYGVARTPWVREGIAERGSLLGWTYAVGVLIGGQLLAATIVLIDATPDEAMQASALLALGVAVALAGWSIASVLDRRDDRVGALLLGVAGAVTTNTMFVISFYYFGTDFALPIIPLN